MAEKSNKQSSSGQPTPSVLKVVEGKGDAEAYAATQRPEGSIHGRDKYQEASKTDRDGDSKSFPRKGM